MEEINLEFLETFLNTPSPSGFEQPAQKLFADYVRPYVERVEVDVHGNVIASRQPEGNPRLMLAAHCDEIGLMINYITDDGFLHFVPIGGVLPQSLEGARVLISGEKGPIPGVIARKPSRLRQENELEKPVKFPDLWIDIGARDRKDAESVVRIGDAAIIATGFQRLLNNLATARGFDDKLGVFVLAESLRFLHGRDVKAAVLAVSTVQEEVGSRGVWGVAYRLKPDMAIVVEVEHASDHPEADKKITGDVRLGQGIGFNRGSNINPQLNELLMEVAREEKIPWHVTAVAGPTPTDASVIHIIREGIPCALVRIPVRYIHSPSEIVSLEDVALTVKFLTAFLQRLSPGLNFRKE